MDFISGVYCGGSAVVFMLQSQPWDLDSLKVVRFVVSVRVLRFRIGLLVQGKVCGFVCSWIGVHGLGKGLNLWLRVGVRVSVELELFELVLGLVLGPRFKDRFTGRVWVRARITVTCVRG